MKDADILQRIESGDERALDYLYQRHYRMMIRYITKNNGTEDEAKDVYQDALIVLWEKVRKGQFVLTAKISTYLYSVCKNLWHKELERKARHNGEMREGTDDSYQHLEKQERLMAIRTCIEALGDTCQKVLMYYYFDRLSMQDIATELGFANADTAKSKKYKCKQELDKLVKSKFKASDFFD